MKIFVDTSALYALFDGDDMNHPAAAAAWPNILRPENVLVASNYVLVETCALLQHRLGLAAVRAFHDELEPVFSVEFVSADLHRSATAALLSASRRSLSLVDWVSFEVMRRLHIGAAFSFDTHFREQGFEVMP
jgi:uncharacterized protein